MWDENRLIRDDFLGQVEIKPEDCTSQESMSFTLEKRSENSRVSGSIKIVCYPMSEDNTPADLASERTPLPEGWEERRDNNGRAYYFDHNTSSDSQIVSRQGSLQSASPDGGSSLPSPLSGLSGITPHLLWTTF